MYDYYQNRYMGIFFNKPEDKLVETVAENFFAKADSPLLNVLNSNFVEGCVDEFLERQTVCLDLNDLPENQDGWTKPSRKNRHKHDKKEYKRKGNAKRFRDRSRKCAHEGHMWKVYHRGMVGDWGRRGRRLAETGEVTFKTSHRMYTDNCTPFIPDPSVDEMDDITMTFGDVSMTMNCSNWRNYESQWTSFCETYAWDEAQNGNVALLEQYWNGVAEEEEEDLKNGRDLKTNLDKDLDGFDDEIFVICSDDDDDEIIDEPAPTPNKKSSYDTSEFTAMELAQMSMKLACANPDQRAWIRKFMETL